MNDEARSELTLKRISQLNLIVTLVISILSLVEWASGVTILTNMVKGYIPVAPSTSLCFFLLSASCLASFHSKNFPQRMIAIFCAYLVLLICLILLVSFITGIRFETEHWGLSVNKYVHMKLSGHMSHITAVNFIMAASGILLVLSPVKKVQLSENIACILEMGVLAVGFIVVVGYLYGTPLLYGGNLVPVALPTAIAFVFLGAGLTLAFGPHALPVKYFLGPSVRSRIMRALYPFLLAYFLVVALVDRIFILWNHPLMSALETILSVTIVGIIITKTARGIGSEVDRANVERDEKEAALKESEEQLRVLASTVDLMYLVDQDCRYLFLNDAYAKRIGLAKDQIIGRQFADFHNEKSSQIFYDCVRQACETRLPYQYEHLSVRNNRYFLRTFSPIYDARNGNTVVTVVSKDITDQKLAEEKLKKSLDELIRFNEVTVDRELRVIELKKEINALLKKSGEPAKYNIIG